MTYKPTNMTTEGHTTFQGPSPNDQILLEDLLSTEKYISGFYDTAVFESADPNVWQAPQHIQHDEQVHGQKLFNYMHSHGMYDIK